MNGLVNQLGIKTFSVQLDGKNYLLTDYLDEKGRVIDSVLTCNGEEIHDDETLFTVQSLADELV